MRSRFFYDNVYPILDKFQFVKFICRYIVYFMQRFDLTISDHRRGDFHSMIYLLREGEWRSCLEKYKDLEVDSRKYTFPYDVKIKFVWRGVELSTEDLPWFLRQNRYRINKVCQGPWYYTHAKYSFNEFDDYIRFKKIAKKYGLLDQV